MSRYGYIDRVTSVRKFTDPRGVEYTIQADGSIRRVNPLRVRLSKKERKRRRTFYASIQTAEQATTPLHRSVVS